MGKSSSSRTGRADSEISSRSERRRTTQDDTEDVTPSRRRSQADSVNSSSSKRRSRHRDDDRDEQDEARSNRYSSNDFTSTVEVQDNDRSRRTDTMSNGRDERRESRRDSYKSSNRSEAGTIRGVEEDPEERRRAGEDRDSERSRRRDSQRESTTSKRSDRDEKSRAFGDHDASLPQNQFPGSFPDTNTQPYRPPGQAADYYGDQGESVQYQPGVRPHGPAYVTNVEQAHLNAPTTESAPPPEPSSIGQVGAAASYFAAGESDNDMTSTLTASRPSAISSSPKTTPSRPGRTSSAGGSISGNTMTTATASMAAGSAAEYFANNNTESSSQSYQNNSSYAPYTASSQYTSYQGDSYTTSPPGHSTKPSGSSTNYAGMAAAGLAGAAAAGYYAHQHHNHEHEHSQSPYLQDANSTFIVGHGQSAFPGMQQQLRHKHRGPLTKLADWFRDPHGVSQFEQYSEVTGVCKYCFDPNTTAADAPRKHYYHKTRPVSQAGRYGTPNRIEKPYRHSSSSSSTSSSSDDEKRKRKRQSSSNTTKVVAGGIAAYGAAKIGEAIYNQHNNFDDTYSVRSGQPIPPDASQVTVNRVDYEDADMYGSGSRRRSSRGSRYSISEDANLRRKDSTSSRKSKRDEDLYVERKRSSKRRGSSSSPSRVSRGTAMSVGAAAGAAGIAALAASERRRSRSRSRERSSKLNRKRSYYSKRVSPRHSYVDLSKRASGAVGFGQFFSSPSANEKQGRKKGLFTWNNDSSSSSDADLAFGEGTVRRKSGKQEKSQRDSSSKFGDTAAILSLAATGAALAAESDRRKSKSGHDTNDSYAGRGSKRYSTSRIRMQSNDHEPNLDGDGVWEDASDDDDSSSDSVDTALAYGGRLSNRNSRESLAEQGTSKWAWRWTPNKDKPSGKERRKNQVMYPQTPPHHDTVDLVSSGLAGAVGAGAGIVAANMTKPSVSINASATPSPLPPMQFVEPFAASDPNLYETRRVYRPDGGPSPHTIVSRSPAPLQQPQAVNAPSIAPIPVVLNKLEADVQLTDSPTEIGKGSEKIVKDRRLRDESIERTRPKRRNSSPPLINPSNTSRNSVSWHLTDEQLENEKRALDKQEKRRRRREEDDRRRSADYSTRDRKLQQEDHTAEPRKDSFSARQDRKAEVDRELQALYAEQKRQIEEQKMLDEYRRTHGESGGIAAAIIGAGVGAAATAMVTESKKSSESDSDPKPRRKSSLKRGSVDASSVSAPARQPSPPRETQQERIAKMTAQRDKNTSSPVHDDYAAFFVPADVAEHVKEHNDAAEKREHDREVLDLITPDMLSAGRRPRFDPFLYSPYRPGKPHEVDYHPRGVPRLGLIEATPPGSPGGARLISRSSPLSQTPLNTDDVDVVDAPLDRDTGSASGSKEVKWGEDKKHVYEVETPEYERNDPTADLARVRTIDDNEAERIENENERKRSHSDREVRDIPEIVIEEHSPDPSPMDELDQDDVLEGRPYRKPFYESISDIGEPQIGDDNHRDIPKTGHGFAVSLPESPVEEKHPAPQPIDPTGKTATRSDEEVPVEEISSDARPSRTERRRLERAMSSSENATPTIRAPEFEPQQNQDHAAEVKVERQMPGGFGVFDYLVDDDGNQMTSEANRLIEASATSTLSRQSKNGPPTQDAAKPAQAEDDIQFPKPKRAATFGDAKETDPKSKSSTAYASDPEDWERSTKKKSKKDKSSKSRSEVGMSSREAFAAVAAGAAAAAAAKSLDHDSGAPSKISGSAVGSEPDFYASKDKSKRRSKRDSDNFEDYDNKSVVSLPATKDENRKSRRRSKRDSDAFDDDEDDTKSVTSMPATNDEESKSKRRSKDKEKEKEKRSSGIFGGIFSSNKSDVSASSKKSSRSSKHESRDRRDEDGDKERRRKRRSKSTDDYEEPRSAAFEELSRSEQQRKDLQSEDDLIKPSLPNSQEADVDDGFVSADDGRPNGDATRRYDDEDQSFLAKGLEMPPPMATTMPMVTDGVSGLEVTERQTPLATLETEEPVNLGGHTDLPPLPDQDETELATLDSDVILANTPSADRTRRLSNLRTQDLDSLPMAMSSPTAVPLPFGRRGPFTPGSAQRSLGSPSIGTPLTTPRTRMNRPKSSSGKDFKPLYLVERHSYQKTGTPDAEEDLPALPSSRASSAQTSMEDLRGTAELHIDPEVVMERGRRHSYSSVNDRTERRQSPDYLDSRAATPVPGDKQKARERELLEIRERRERESQWKSLFHSPSELLQDPALNREIQDENVDIARVGSPLPSVVSTDHEQEFMSAESRPESPTQDLLSQEGQQPRSRSAGGLPQPAPRTLSSERRSRSASRTQDVAAIAGLGIAGGVIAGLATERLFNQQDGIEEKFTEPEHNASVEEPITADNIPDDKAFEPTMGKKSKKDKKKKNKRKTLDLAASAGDEESAINLEGTLASTDPGDAAQLSRDLSSIPTETNDYIESSAPTKKSKKDKKKAKNGKTSEEALQAIDIATAQNADLRDVEEPATAVPFSDDGHGHSNDKDFGAQEAFVAALMARILENERMSLARDQPEAETGELAKDGTKALSTSMVDNDRSLNVEPFVPTFAEINQPDNQLGAFEEAFERAVRARGLTTDVSREDALQVFLPKRQNAPFVPKPDLTPVPEGSPASVRTPANETEQPGSNQAEDGIKHKLSKKDKKKLRKSNLSTPETPEDAFQEDRYDGALAAKNPFGDDFDVKPSAAAEEIDRNIQSSSAPKNFEAAPLKLTPIQTVEEGQPQPESTEAGIDDFAIVPSKKDKRKKKKSQASAVLSEPADIIEIDTPTTNLSREITLSSTPADEEWDQAPGKKGKKSKKSKKNQAKVDWTEVATVVAAGTGIAALGVAAADGVSSSKDEANPRSTPTEDDRVQEGPDTSVGTSEVDRFIELEAASGMVPSEADKDELAQTAHMPFTPVEASDKDLHDVPNTNTSGTPSAVAAKGLSESTQQQSTRELALDAVASELPKSDGSRHLVGDKSKELNNAATPQPSKQTTKDAQEQKPSSASASFKVPPNPFAVNLSVADAIALSMGQNIVTLSSTKPEKKTKAVLGQGSAWTAWTPFTASTNSPEKVEAVSDKGFNQNQDLSGRVIDGHTETQVLNDNDRNLITSQELDTGQNHIDTKETAPTTEDIVPSSQRSIEPDNQRGSPEVPAEGLTLPPESAVEYLEQPKDFKEADPQHEITPTNLEPDHSSTQTDRSTTVTVVPEAVDPQAIPADPKDSENLESQLRAGKSIPNEAEADEFWSVPSKKSKKDEKKRKSAVESSTPTISETNSVAEVAREGSPTKGSSTPQPSDQTHTVEGLPVTQAGEALGESLTETADSNWNIPVKLSKKDKKKRKKLNIGAEDPATLADKSIEDSARDIAASQDSLTMISGEQPQGKQETEITQSAQKPSTPMDEREESEWSLPVKMSKKDKKKKRKSLINVEEAESDDVCPISRDEEPSGEAESFDSKAQDMAVTGTEPQPSINEQIVESERIAEISLDDEWAITKKSKKDKKEKKKHKSVADLEEPDTTAKAVLEEDTGVPSIAEAQTPTEEPVLPIVETQPESSREVDDTPAEEEWALPAKLSKKDKKKKKKVGLVEEPEEKAAQVTVANVNDEGVVDVQEATLDKEAVTIPPSTDPADVQQPDTSKDVKALVERQSWEPDDWEFTTSSKKKDKKKKKGKSIAAPDVETEKSAADASIVQDTENTHETPEASMDPAESERLKDDQVPTSPGVPAPEIADDEWDSFTTKISKKDKKKKRKSAKSSTELESEPMSTDLSSKVFDGEAMPSEHGMQGTDTIEAVIQNEPIPDTTAVEPVTAIDDDWAISRESSKMGEKNANEEGSQDRDMSDLVKSTQVPEIVSIADTLTTTASMKQDTNVAEKISAIKDRSAQELHTHETHTSWLSSANAAASNFPPRTALVEPQDNEKASGSLNPPFEGQHSEPPSESQMTPTDGEAQTEFSWAPAKKSKKDKKKNKRKSTGSPDEVNDDVAILAAATGAATLAATAAATGRESGSDIAAAQGEAAAEQHTQHSPTQIESARSIPPVSIPGSFEDSIGASDEVQDDSVFASALATPGDTPLPQPAEISWTTAFKKNKKDNKKRKSVAWSDADTSTPATPVNEDAFVPPQSIIADSDETSRDLQTASEAEPPSTIMNEAEIDVQPLKADLPTPGTEKDEFEWPTVSKKKSKKKEKKREESAEESQSYATDVESAAVELAETSANPVVVTEDSQDIQEATSEDWTESSSSKKKKKKEKKKKRTSSAVDWDQPHLGNNERDVVQTDLNDSTDQMILDVVEPDGRPSSPTRLPGNNDAMDVETKESKPQSETLALSQTTDESKEYDIVEEVSRSAENVAEDEWALPGKKSKKDKKRKKKGQSTADDNDIDMGSAAAIATFAPEDSLKAAGVELVRDLDAPTLDDLTWPSTAKDIPMIDAPVEEDWSFDVKKAKKDKKKKKREMLEDKDDVNRELQTEQGDENVKKDKDNGLVVDENRSLETGEAVLAAQGTDRLVSEVLSDVKETQVDKLMAVELGAASGAEQILTQDSIEDSSWAPTRKQSKKDKKKKRRSTAGMPDDESEFPPKDEVDAISTKVVKEVPNYVRDFSVHELHKVPQHQDYLDQAHAIASSFPSRPSDARDLSASNLKTMSVESGQNDAPTQPTFESGHDSDVSSNVSEETRERRRRRRSPPLMRDHDPEDLPRDRALTPPPDHDDMMDTALTIAAGLGFGESENRQPGPDPVKSRSSKVSQPSLPSLAFDSLGIEHNINSEEFNRDSGVQFESPTTMHENAGTIRDSGFVPSPPLRGSWSREDSVPSERRPRPQSPTSSTEDLRRGRRSATFESDTPRDELSFHTPARRQPLPVDSASKERSSVVFNSSPAAASTPSKTPRSDKKPVAELRDLPVDTAKQHDTSSIYDQQARGRARSEGDDSHVSRKGSNVSNPEGDRSIFPPATREHLDRPGSPPKGPLQTIHEDSSPLDMAAVGAAALGLGTAAAIVGGSSRDDDDTPQSKSLGSSETRTGSQRNLRDSATSPSNLAFSEDAEAIPGTARDMSGNDVYDGYGSFPGSPMSPTRPPSVRKRQSMQQIKDLEARVDQLANENRSLAEAKLAAERHLEEFQSLGAPRSGVDDEALRSANEQLQERDYEIHKLRGEITALAATHAALKTSHDEKHNEWETTSRELVGLRSQHEELSSGMDEMVKYEIATALAAKNAELQRLRLDLENARLKIRELQSQILARGADEIVIVRDEDYFENACQNLCQHVQGWVVRFSKFSDTRVCRSMKEVRDEKVLDRFDNALLDGSDIDPYLADRVKRRDIFMSVVMTMIWEYVFTRYLFGMDRDQRQKLKQLEKNLAEVGPAHAVHQWRALTLTLLSKRPSFRAQCESDTEAVVVEVMKALSRFLPPPQNLEAQISDSLRKVMKVAVDLSVEMRTQRAEYIMLPPLQPEYDMQGDVTQKVYFNANLMNERSGEFESNEQLEESKAVVRIVLFPLVVKKGDDDGRGDAEFVVCPAQVLVARADKGKRPKSRITSAGSAADARSLRAASTHSLAMSGVDMTGAGNMI